MRSKTLREMLDSRKGYRCESYAGGRPGWRPLRSMLDYEVVSLGNADVIEGFCKRFRISCGPINRWWDDLAGLKETIADSVEKELGKSEALWLTTRDGAKANYCERDEEPDEYEITRDTIPISDLGSAGTLFLRRRRR